MGRWQGKLEKRQAVLGRIVEALFDRLFDSDDTDGYKLAQGVLGGRFTWLEEGIVDPAG